MKQPKRWAVIAVRTASSKQFEPVPGARMTVEDARGLVAMGKAELRTRADKRNTIMEVKEKA